MLLYSQESYNWKTKSKNRKIAFPRQIDEISIDLNLNLLLSLYYIIAEIRMCKFLFSTSNYNK